MKKRLVFCQGFTIIELMVVVTIIIVLSGISLAGYYRFSQRQSALNDARNFSTILRRVQAMAKNLVYPESCDSLIKYNLQSDESGWDCEDCQTVSAWAVCSNNSFNVIDKEKVMTKAFFTSDVSVDFEAGTGRINYSQAVFPLTNSNDDYAIEVKVDENGVISAREYETLD